MLNNIADIAWVVLHYLNKIFLLSEDHARGTNHIKIWRHIPKFASNEEKRLKPH